MSGRYEYQDAGSSYGQMQRVAASGQYNKVHRAYRKYIDHGETCTTCAVDSSICTTAGALWEAYSSANGA